MIETQVNRCVIDGELVELDDLRYTPAGLARAIEAAAKQIGDPGKIQRFKEQALKLLKNG